MVLEAGKFYTEGPQLTRAIVLGHDVTKASSGRREREKEQERAERAFLINPLLQK